MKTKLICLVAVIFISHAVMAQFHIGIKGGANMNKVDGKSFTQEFSYGSHLGGFAEIGFGNRFGIQPEVLFNQYTTKVDSSFNVIYKDLFNNAKNGNIKLNYLSIPVLLTYKVIGPLSIQAGPQFGILIDQDKTLLENGGQAFKNGDFSLIAGAQLKIAALRVSGRYAIGLNNINDIDNRDQWKNQVLQLSVGIAF